MGMTHDPRAPHTPMSSRGLSPGSNVPQAPACVGLWIPALNAGMTSVVIQARIDQYQAKHAREAAE